MVLLIFILADGKKKAFLIYGRRSWAH
jgi:hypothetical protein